MRKRILLYGIMFLSLVVLTDSLKKDKPVVFGCCWQSIPMDSLRIDSYWGIK